MSSILDGQFQDQVSRRQAEIGLGFGGASKYFSNVGDDVTDGPTDGRTGTLAAVVDSEGARERISTISTSNDYNHIRGLSIWRREFEVAFYCKFKLSSISNVRTFIGLTSLTPDAQSASDSPTGHYAGIVKEFVNSNFRFKTAGGAGVTTVSDAAADTSTHDFYMWLKRSGGGNLVAFQLDNNARQFFFTNLPANSQNLAYVVVVRTLTGAVKSIDIGKIHMDGLF